MTGHSIINAKKSWQEENQQNFYPASVYHLSAATYRRLGAEAAYIRQRGFEPIQHEQMVIQYVDKHGTISRKDVADLCKIGLPQAYRLLQHLKAKGLIEPSTKQGRSVRYRKKQE